jgi:AcrR family transcriptional regulator
MQNQASNTSEYEGWEARAASRALARQRKAVLGRSHKLVRAALEILEAQGYEELTVQAVVARAGLSLRAFYQRFSGKDELLIAVFEESIRATAAELTAWAETSIDPLERVERFVTALYRRSFEVPRSSDLLSREHLRLAEERPDELVYATAPLKTPLTRYLEDGMRTGQIRQTEPARLAVFIYQLVVSMIHANVLGEEPIEDLDRATSELWDFCRHAIATSDGPTR